MLPLLTKAVLEEKTNTCNVMTNAVPCAIEDHKLFKKMWICASGHII